jgi:hypothetical protein
VKIIVIDDKIYDHDLLNVEIIVIDDKIYDQDLLCVDDKIY